MGFEPVQEKNVKEPLFDIHNAKEFTRIALDAFYRQYSFPSLYRDFCTAIGRNPDNVSSLEQIPFLPIQFFKTNEVKTGNFSAQAIFTSSGTTGTETSRHFVKDLTLYKESFARGFALFYGPPTSYCILGLLPSYLERSGSSLVYMVNELVTESNHPQSGFYLHDHQALSQTLTALEAAGQKTILFGVSYALLDFAAAFPAPLKHTVVIETGGMKGRRKEITKDELYAVLRNAFQTEEIHSEYGMTELLSQAYAINGYYRTPPWMKILLREETDPLSFSGTAGAINVIDLANKYSCSFIATDDRGRLHADGSFEVLGRLDNSDIRGCSQLMP